MAKYPTPGRVKTRLAEAIGAAAACALYTAFLRDLAVRLGGGPWRLVWAVDPPGSDLSVILGGEGRCIDQRGADLGARMRHCFEELFAAGAGRVVMIGADAPHLSRQTVSAALTALDEHDVSIVPTRDGGYCLIGLRAAVDLFTGVAMGTAAVWAQTRERIARLGLCAAVLPETFDVDDAADLDELRRLMRSGTVALPNTAALLAALR
jgi:hypothetical protein